jgi:Tfp pilus assembly protein PilO
MAVLTRTRRRFRIAAIALVVVAALSGLYLVLPGGTDAAAKWGELNNRRNEFKNIEMQVRPLRDLPRLLEQSRKDIARFYSDRLPSRYSVVIAELGRLASRSGVTLSEVDYNQIEISKVQGLQALVMKASVTGRYANIARFINALERNEKVFFLIKGIELSDEDEGRVALRIELETYLRPRMADEARAQADNKPVGRRSESD